MILPLSTYEKSALELFNSTESGISSEEMTGSKRMKLPGAQLQYQRGALTEGTHSLRSMASHAPLDCGGRAL